MQKGNIESLLPWEKGLGDEALRHMKGWGKA